MNKGVIGVIFFMAGGAAGFLAANKLMKDKYEQLVQDEIDSVKAAFRKEHPLPEEKSGKAYRKGTDCIQPVYREAGLYRRKKACTDSGSVRDFTG